MAFRVGFTDFPSLYCHVAAGGSVTTVVYVCIYALMIMENDDFNKGCLLGLGYIVLIRDGIQNWFHQFFQYDLSCNFWQCHLIDNDNFEVNIFLATKGLFFFLKAFLVLSQI